MLPKMSWTFLWSTCTSKPERHRIKIMTGMIVVCRLERRGPSIILKRGGGRREGHQRCVRRWLKSLICACKVLLQWGQGMVAGAGGLRALFFLSWLCFSAEALWSDLYWRAPAWTAARQLALSDAACFHDDGPMPKAVKEPFSVSLNLSFGHHGTACPPEVHKIGAYLGVCGLAYGLRSRPSKAGLSSRW